MRRVIACFSVLSLIALACDGSQANTAEDGGADTDGGDDRGGEATCGRLGQMCCNDNTCTQGGVVCANGVCTTCGRNGEPCCPGNMCGYGLACANNVCAPCGALGQPCCAGNSCNNDGSCTSGHICGCGDDGQPCCVNDAGVIYNQCNVGSGCSSNLDFGSICRAYDPCGPNSDCSKGGCCDQNLGNGRCVPDGQGCSGGQGSCNMGGCQNGTCGKLGQQCCGGGVDCTQAYTDCRNGMCAACGHVNEPCCPNNSCEPMRTCNGQNMCQ